MDTAANLIMEFFKKKAKITPDIRPSVHILSINIQSKIFLEL